MEPEPPAELAPAATAPAWVPEGLRGRPMLWLKLLSAYFSSQSLAQLLSVAAGLVLVRFLAVRELALYTLAASAVAFYGFLSDLGSTGSLLYFFQRSRRDGEDFEPYVAAVAWLRTRALALGAATVLVALPALARSRGFGLGESLLVAGAVVANVWFQMVSAIRLQLLRLSGEYGRAYRADIVSGGTRLAGAGLMATTGALVAWLGIAAAAVAQAASAGLAKPVRAPSKPPPETLSAARKAVLRFLLPTLPSALYFSIQGQLTVWFAALLGSTENVAQIGALARLGMLMSLFTGLTTVIFLPRLAAITEEGLYRRRCLQFGAFLALLALAILGFAWLAPRLFLLLLGSHYQHLEEELLIVVAASGLTLLGGYAVAVNTARAWNRWQGLCVLALAASQAVLAALLPLSTTAGLLWFNLGTSAVGLLLQMIVMGFGFLRPRWVHWA